ncbi:hypothetical protein Y1Q_0017662 [Alligator mississippiensis]|uniref:Uncharacterized protein n=1 Tax=Alligator mississippiensis TaxID=8496 RepID=A0A151N0Z8_ALLMI|nr:hypothetical protein Y1Q_0017662 [Alligator mississippiensis]
MRPWPHRHLQDPGTVPVTLDSIDSCLKVYGQRNIVVLRIVLNPLVDHPVISLLHQLSRLRVLMEPRLSSECQRPTEAQNMKHCESERPVLRQRTQEERYMFGFLLQRSGLNKRPLQILGDAGQWQLAYELDFHFLEEGDDDDDSSTISSSC